MSCKPRLELGLVNPALPISAKIDTDKGLSVADADRILADTGYVPAEAVMA